MHWCWMYACMVGCMCGWTGACMHGWLRACTDGGWMDKKVEWSADSPGSFSPDTPLLSQSLHLPRPSPSFRRLSVHLSRFFRDSTCSLHRFISSKKLSSTSRVISNMAALKTVSMTPESWDWKFAIASAIALIKCVVFPRKRKEAFCPNRYKRGSLLTLNNV